jgi:hypothetical protein
MVFDVRLACQQPRGYGALTAPRLRQRVIVEGIMSSTIVCVHGQRYRGVGESFQACLFAGQGHTCGILRRTAKARD